VSESNIGARTARLAEILRSEKELLLTGRARDAILLMDEKMEALRSLEDYLSSRDANSIPLEYRTQIETIVDLSRENAIHFEAVRNGLRHAIERLETMHGSAYVGSYTQDGSKVPFTEVTGQFRRMA
jgi:predicted transcriptional regulator